MNKKLKYFPKIYKYIRNMDKLKVTEIKNIFKFLGIRHYTGLKKNELLQRMRDEGLYDTYLNKKKEENQQKEKINKLQNEKEKNFQDFKDTINMTNSYNEDESDEEDSVCEEDFEVIYDDLLIYGDFYGLEDKMNEKKTDKEKKEFLISTGIEDINEANYRFGNSLQFSQNRSHSRYYIGKNDELIVPEMFGDGDLVVPYEITKFNKNATRAIDMEMVDSIYLRHDDDFVKYNIKGKIYKKWNWKILYDNQCNCFQIEFPNGKIQEFNKNTHVNDILNFIQNSDKKKASIKIKVTYNKNYAKIIHDYFPIVPSTWKQYHGGSNGSTDGGEINYSYSGPEDEKEPMEVLLKKSFDNKEGIAYSIT